jgi:hypothetical protein
MEASRTEILHRRGNSQCTGNSMHADSVCTFQIRVELSDLLVFQKGPHS